MNQKMIFRSLFAAAGFLLLSAGCALDYVRYAEYDRGIWETSREYAASKEAVWRATLVAMENFPVAFTDAGSCFVRTDPVEADSLTVYRIGWSDSEPELDHPAYARFSIHVMCSPVSEGRTRVHVHIREQVSVPALRLVPYSDQPKPVMIDLTTRQRTKGGGDSATIGYREQLLLAAIGKLLGEEVVPPELKKVEKSRCVATYQDDGAKSDCPDADNSKTAGPPAVQP